jgi:two-component system response regulator YesN
MSSLQNGYHTQTCMRAHLEQIKNWPTRAEQAGWSIATLAKTCGVSTDTLRRYFQKQSGKTTQAWLDEQRQQRAIELLNQGFSIKETACYLGYKQQTNFTRKFKKFWGICPSSTNIAADPLRFAEK